MRKTRTVVVSAGSVHCGSSVLASALNRGWCSPHTSTKLNWHCTCTGGGCAAGAVPLWPVLDGAVWAAAASVRESGL
jgi:hypothetical protein